VVIGEGGVAGVVPISLAGCGGGNQCTSLLGFIGAVFGRAATFTCLEGFAGCDFNFEAEVARLRQGQGQTE